MENSTDSAHDTQPSISLTSEPSPSSTDLPNTSSSAHSADMEIKVHHAGTTHPFHLPPSATLTDLSTLISNSLSIPTPNQKLLIAPKPGLLKPPFSTDTTPLSSLLSNPKTKITLLGSRPEQIASLNASIEQTKKAAQPYAGPLKPATPARRPPTIAKLLDATTYTFLSIKPLPYLPNPSRSQAYLERLASDPGIRAAMAAHKWSVGLLTEMNPAEHTTHESRTLGLNRNAGEVIELRLRTDAYDGYRDYKTIRKTLCHELTHNVHSEHDRKFWELCGQVEKEVERGDWKSGGRRLGEDAFYEGPEPQVGREGEVADHGAWTGRSYKVGETAGGSGSGGSAIQADLTLDRREVLAKAAEERAKRLKAQKRSTGEDEQESKS